MKKTLKTFAAAAALALFSLAAAAFAHAGNIVSADGQPVTSADGQPVEWTGKGTSSAGSP
jgi:hypothetical protein